MQNTLDTTDFDDLQTAHKLWWMLPGCNGFDWQGDRNIPVCQSGVRP